MATNKQILHAIKVVDRGMVNNKTYHSMHRSITQISNGNHVIRNDIREISTYCIRNRDVNNK